MAEPLEWADAFVARNESAVCGFVTARSLHGQVVVVESAPLIRWIIGLPVEMARARLAEKGWTVERTYGLGEG